MGTVNARGSTVLCLVGLWLRPYSGFGGQCDDVVSAQGNIRSMQGTDRLFFGSKQHTKDYVGNLPHYRKWSSSLSNITQLVKIPDSWCGIFFTAPSFLSLCSWTGKILLVHEDNHAVCFLECLGRGWPKASFLPGQESWQKRWWKSFLRIPLPIFFQQR